MQDTAQQNREPEVQPEAQLWYVVDTRDELQGFVAQVERLGRVLDVAEELGLRIEEESYSLFRYGLRDIYVYIPLDRLADVLTRLQQEGLLAGEMLEVPHPVAIPEGIDVKVCEP